MSDVHRREVIEVEHNGEEKTVYNSAQILRSYRFEPVNSFEVFPGTLLTTDKSCKADVITEHLAERLYNELGYRATEHDVEVVNIEAEDVTVL